MTTVGTLYESSNVNNIQTLFTDSMRQSFQRFTCTVLYFLNSKYLILKRFTDCAKEISIF